MYVGNWGHIWTFDNIFFEFRGHITQFKTIDYLMNNPTTIYKQLRPHRQFSFFDETDRLYGFSPVSIAQVPKMRVYQMLSTAIRLLRVS